MLFVVLCRVSLPALPKGVLQIIVVDGANRPCFMQQMLVLPAPAAQEMNTLWSQLLRGQLSTAPAPAATPTSTSTAGSAAAGSSEVVPASRSSSMQSSGSMPDAATGQAKRVGPQEIQALWQHTFYRIVTDIAALLLARKPAGAQAAAESPAAAAGGPQVIMDTPESRRKISSLTHFLAANGKWAVLELLTDHVFGSGSSARAMYATRTLAGTAAAPVPVLSATAPVAAPAGPDSAGTEPASTGAAGAAGSAQVGTSEIQPAELQSPAAVNSSAGSSSGGKQPPSAEVPTAAPAAGARDRPVAHGGAGAVDSTAAKAGTDRSLFARLRLKFKAALKDK